MTFVKIYKNNAYFKRFQTKFRRRREGKTDYYARKRLTHQDKDKYNTMKYRFVTRITATKVICQVIYATLTGDRVLCEANSTELKKFGLEAGLTNYASAYATGLLLARRLLKQTGLDKLYAGAASVTGEYFTVQDKVDEERHPFKAILDVGLVKTTTGNRVFGAMKGACDGGLNIPHSTNRFPGYSTEGEADNYDAKVHRERIFGGHVDNYMKHLTKQSAEDFKLQFTKWGTCLKKNNVDTIAKLYAKIFEQIRKNPDRATRTAKTNFKREHSKYRLKKLNKAQKRVRAAKKLEAELKKKKK